MLWEAGRVSPLRPSVPISRLLSPLNSPQKTLLEQFKEHFKQYLEHVSPQRRIFPSRAAGAARLREVDQFIGVKSTEALRPLTSRHNYLLTWVNQILMRRGMIRVDDGYQYSYDTALRNTQAERFSEPQYRAILESIECPVMIIIGTTQDFFSVANLFIFRSREIVIAVCK